MPRSIQATALIRQSLSSLLMFYPVDYFDSRSRFIESFTNGGFELNSHPIEARGPAGEQLTIDVARRIPDRPKATLVVSSGLHGVEGYVGAAIQFAALDEFRKHALPDDVMLVFVHALSPYGFAWNRRFDERNVDPNRNFLLPSENYEGCSEIYKRLSNLINPSSPDNGREFFRSRAVSAIIRHGYRRGARAVASGQYEFPNGLFYGGSEPSESTAIVQSQLANWLELSEHNSNLPVFHLDVHSGLGRRGQLQLMIEQPLSTDSWEWLRRHFDRKSMVRLEADELLYRARGSFGRWCVEKSRPSDYTFLFAEFGTYPSLRVLAGLRDENRSRQWEPDNAEKLAKTRRQLAELFCPEDHRWRRQVAETGRRIVFQAIDAIRDRAHGQTVANG